MQVQISLFLTLLVLCSFSNANQITHLHRLFMSRKSQNSPVPSTWALLDETRDYSPVYVAPQEGLMQADKIDKLPGQPDTVDFDQYAGYVTVDPAAERALFYYFVESPTNSSTNPLVLWLNGGPGCSSLGYGAMEELGPFRVNTDGKTLSRNNYAWNNVANVIFLESPAGVGFSYTKTSSPYNTTGDKSTASDAYTFLINWFERFPQYKTREFYITGESYSGHYVPQLAHTILLNNKNSNHTVINLKGIAMGNAWIEDLTSARGIYDYFWTHALISDETHNGIVKFCGLLNGNLSDECWSYADKTPEEIGNIEINNIYAPVCLNKSIGNSSGGSVDDFDPCSDTYVEYYLNNPDVQNALHTRSTNWTACRQYNWTDSPDTVLPVIKDLIGNGLRIWIYRQVLFYIKAFFELDFVDVVYVELKDNDLSSGDIDANVPVTSSRYSISSLKLPIQTAWHPWYLDNEVGGYVVEYEGLTFVTVRGAGHLVPSYQPQRALTMISSFLQGILLPSA